MKKLIIAIIVISFSSCTSNYSKANDALEQIKKHQYSLDSLYKLPVRNQTEIDFHALVIRAHVDLFKKTITKVSDQAKQFQLIQKFDRIYVLQIEK